MLRTDVGRIVDGRMAGPTAAEPVALHGHEDHVCAVTFSPDGHWLATGSYDRTVRLWDVSTALNTGVY